jgi:hypothetical protein
MPWAERQLRAFQNSRVLWCQAFETRSEVMFVLRQFPLAWRILYLAQGQHFTDSKFLSMILLPLASQWDGASYIRTEFVASPDHPAMRYLARICSLEQVAM